MEQILFIGVVGALIIFLVQKLLFKRGKYWEKYGLPTLESEDAVSRVMKNISFLEYDSSLYKKLNGSKFGAFDETGNLIIFIKDLDLAKQMQVKDFDYFPNRRMLNAKDVNWNEGVNSKRDQEWKNFRGTLSPVFSTGKNRRIFPLMQDSAEKFRKFILDRVDKNGSEINVDDAIGRYAMELIASAAFGIEGDVFKANNSVLLKMANKLQLEFAPVMMLHAFISKFIPPSLKFLQPPLLNKEADEFFTKMLKTTIRVREETGQKRNDFLQYMIDLKNGKLAKDNKEKEEGQMESWQKDQELKNTKSANISIDTVVANSIGFIFGGFDTTKFAIVFSAYALALNQHVQNKLRKELQDAIEDNGGDVTYDLINRNEYLDKVINEVLRMYPPAVRTERQCSKDYKIPNTNAIVPKGSLVWFPIYQFHHDEKYFPNPEKFDPERFSPENKVKRHPYAYMPFGHGPRSCIAVPFALSETKTVIASLILHFDIEPSEKTCIPMKFSNNSGLRPLEDLHLKLTPRK